MDDSVREAIVREVRQRFSSSVHPSDCDFERSPRHSVEMQWLTWPLELQAVHSHPFLAHATPDPLRVVVSACDEFAYLRDDKGGMAAVGVNSSARG